MVYLRCQLSAFVQRVERRFSGLKTGTEGYRLHTELIKQRVVDRALPGINQQIDWLTGQGSEGRITTATTGMDENTDRTILKSKHSPTLFPLVDGQYPQPGTTEIKLLAGL